MPLGLPGLSLNQSSGAGIDGTSGDFVVTGGGSGIGGGKWGSLVWIGLAIGAVIVLVVWLKHRK